MTSGVDRKLLSASCFPGHQTPGTPPQLGAADMSRIGLPVCLASASPASNSVYQAIASGIIPAFAAVCFGEPSGSGFSRGGLAPGPPFPSPGPPFPSLGPPFPSPGLPFPSPGLPLLSWGSPLPSGGPFLPKPFLPSKPPLPVPGRIPLGIISSRVSSPSLFLSSFFSDSDACLSSSAEILPSLSRSRASIRGLIGKPPGPIGGPPEGGCATAQMVPLVIKQMSTHFPLRFMRKSPSMLCCSQPLFLGATLWLRRFLTNRHNPLGIL